MTVVLYMPINMCLAL